MPEMTMFTVATRCIRRAGKKNERSLVVTLPVDLCASRDIKEGDQAIFRIDTTLPDNMVILVIDRCGKRKTA